MICRKSSLFTNVNRCSHSRRYGFAFLEIIIVLVVIALMAGWYFRKGDNPHAQAASQYQHSMERANNTACLASRQAVRGSIQIQTMQNPGQPVTKEALEKAGIRVNVCPEGGDITVSPDGTLTCSKHQP